MKCVTIIGARPQFIKAAPMSSAMISAGLEEVLIHTGQHFDYEMSQVFFDELNIPPPKYNLDISGGSHAEMTGQMVIGVENKILKEKPDFVLVYGDTNSTLSGGLAAAKIHIPVVHMEAGIRSFNKRMPEEINRILTDHVSSLLLCPSETAIANLKNEGINRGVLNVGDIMADAAKKARNIVFGDNSFLPRLEGFNFTEKFDLLTLHRAENTDDELRMGNIIDALSRTDRPTLFPIHPRTKKKINDLNIVLPEKVTICEPLSYLSMASVLHSSTKVLTDSGGLQKEAYWAKKPCITLRDETEWVETLNGGANTLVGSETEKIVNSIHSISEIEFSDNLYGDGNSASTSVDAIIDFFSKKID